MFVRKLLYPLFNIISIRYIHTNHHSCYLSQKSIRNYINKDCLEIWDIYNIYTLEHIWTKSFLKNHLLSKHDLHNLGITSGFCNVHRSNYKYSETSTIVYSLYKLINNMVSIQINDNNNIFGLTIIFIINI